jgi:hypothetical protein
MWFCSSPFGIAHHLAKSSWVFISGHGVFMISFIRTWGRVMSSLGCCFAAFAFSSGYWNISFQTFVCKICMAASRQFDCWYAGWRSNTTLTGSSEYTFKRLPSWWIRLEKWFRTLGFTKSKYDWSTTCCVISD